MTQSTALPELKVGSLVKLKPKQGDPNDLPQDGICRTGWKPALETAEKLFYTKPLTWNEDWKWVIHTNNLTKTHYKGTDYFNCWIEENEWDRQFWKTSSKDSLFLVLELKESVKRLEEELDIAIQLDKETPKFSVIDFAIVVPVQDPNREVPIWVKRDEVEIVRP